jgi:hypothetical protein
LIDHVVLLNVKQSVAPRDVDALAATVHALGDIDQVESVAWGPNTSTEGLDHGYSHGFVVRFADQAGLDAYTPHAIHRRVVEAVEATADGVLVFDITT